MKQNGPKKVHFLGVGGSGSSAAAIIAKKSGFEVTGCNLQLDTPYLQKVIDHKIKIFEGHDTKHVEDVDILATSPALFFSNKKIEELETAKKSKKVMSWQKFVGEFLLKNKKIIAVSGTHGKSTTTAMIGLMLEQVKQDPTVLIGAKVKEWNANFRWGNSDIFLIESDEFYNNFHNYEPDYILINNIEFEHPDFFKDENEVFESFKRFIKKLRGQKILIVNQDSPGVIAVLKSLSKSTLKDLGLIGYTTQNKALFDFGFLYKARKIKLQNGNYSYEVGLKNETNMQISLSVPGLHNVSNSLGAVAVLDQMDLDVIDASTKLKSFSGIGRRIELIAEKNGIRVFDDYAHHPTEIKIVLEALRKKYKKEKIIAVIEPHTFIRTKKLLNLYKGIFKFIDKVLIGPVFNARDDNDFGVSGKDIVQASGHNNIIYIEYPEKIPEIIKEMKLDNAVIVIMGAGNSYKWARGISDQI